MDTAFQEKLTGLGISDVQIAKLVEEGVNLESDMAFLTSAQIKEVTGCGMVTAAKVAAAFAPAPPLVTVAGNGETDPDAEIPDGVKPSPAQVNNFASSLGMDPSMLSMFMVAGMAGNTGMGGMDLSSMISVPAIVAGYNPKVRNMFLMVMDQVENRLGVPIIVINGDGSINRDLTIEYIMGLEEGRDSAEDNIYYDDSSTPYELVSVGVDAQSIYPADPLESTKALAKNGMGVGRVNWSGVADEVKQVVFFAVRSGEIDPKNESHTSWLRDHLTKSSRYLVMHGMAPKAIAKFNEAKRTGELPTLLVTLSRAPRAPRFMPNRRRVVPKNLSGLGTTTEEDGQ